TALSRGLGDVYKRQVMHLLANQTWKEAAQHQTTVEVQRAVAVFLQHIEKMSGHRFADDNICLLYTSDAVDEFR
ncbi:hypothetical protein H8941_18405, partial [Bacillus pumilus]|uniref:hypothetical protein n=1 Tax=Bacillus pumilus TaxID=1408 RepID=UPI00164CF5EF